LRNDPGGPTWIIRDNGRSFRTGCREEQRASAEDVLKQYVTGEYTPSNTKVAYIYYITAAHSAEYPIKIGFTTFAVNRRLLLIQVGNPNPLICLATEIGTQEMELDRHKRFAHLHIRGEWFRRDPGLMKFIDSLNPHKIYV
jgi:hypothetical protein